jgi:structural maintenance of chromosome 1
MAMDIDEDEGVQRPRQVESYGIEVDFENLDAEDREVSFASSVVICPLP